MTMIALDISSPLVAAVHLGASGQLAATVGNEEDAFAILVQAALQLSLGTATVRGGE